MRQIKWRGWGSNPRPRAYESGVVSVLGSQVTKKSGIGAVSQANSTPIDLPLIRLCLQFLPQLHPNCTRKARKDGSLFTNQGKYVVHCLFAGSPGCSPAIVDKSRLFTSLGLLNLSRLVYLLSHPGLCHYTHRLEKVSTGRFSK